MENVRTQKASTTRRWTWIMLLMVTASAFAQHIDGKTSQFYSQDGKPTSQEAALDRAMPEERTHSQNQKENSLGFGR